MHRATATLPGRRDGERSDSFSTMPARKAPRANDAPNSSDDPKATPSAIARIASVNSSREPTRTTSVSNHGMTRRPKISMSTMNSAAWNSARATSSTLLSPARLVSRPGLPRFRSGEGRQEHEDQDGEEVLDDQPANRNVAGMRIEDVAVLQRAQKHDGAGNGKTEAEDDPLGGRPSPELTDAESKQRRRRALADGTRHGDRAYCDQLFQREVQSDAEHEQDDADLGQLKCQVGIGGAAGRVRADGDAGEEVSEDGR